MLSPSIGKDGGSLAAGSFFSFSKLGAAGIFGSTLIRDSLELGGLTVPKLGVAVGGNTPKFELPFSLGKIELGVEGYISPPCPVTPVPIEGTTIVPFDGFTELDGLPTFDDVVGYPPVKLGDWIGAGPAAVFVLPKLLVVGQAVLPEVTPVGI